MTRKELINNPPKYDNLTDRTSLESGVCEEITNIVEELRNLANVAENLNHSFVNRMKREALTWEDVAKELAELQNQIENTTDFVLEKFD